MAGESIWTRSVHVACVRVALLGAAMALGACNKDSGSAPAAAPVPHVKPKPVLPKTGPTAAEQTAGMVLASAVGKSQVPVELKFDIANKPKVGQPVEINLALISQVSATPATIQVSGADDVSVAPGGNQLSKKSGWRRAKSRIS